MLGKTLSAAKTKIRQHHCKVGNVTRKTSSNHLRGKVIKQSPKAGKRFANGHKVNLTVGKGGPQVSQSRGRSVKRSAPLHLDSAR